MRLPTASPPTWSLLFHQAYWSDMTRYYGLHCSSDFLKVIVNANPRQKIRTPFPTFFSKVVSIFHQRLSATVLIYITSLWYNIYLAMRDKNKDVSGRSCPPLSRIISILYHIMSNTIFIYHILNNTPQKKRWYKILRNHQPGSCDSSYRVLSAASRVLLSYSLSMATSAICSVSGLPNATF